MIMKELPVLYDLCPMYSCEYIYHDYVMLDIYYIPGYMNIVTINYYVSYSPVVTHMMVFVDCIFIGTVMSGLNSI